jgi:hypothetical protein
MDFRKPLWFLPGSIGFVGLAIWLFQTGVLS